MCPKNAKIGRKCFFPNGGRFYPSNHRIRLEKERRQRFGSPKIEFCKKYANIRRFADLDKVFLSFWVKTDYGEIGSRKSPSIRKPDEKPSRKTVVQLAYFCSDDFSFNRPF